MKIIKRIPILTLIIVFTVALGCQNNPAKVEEKLSIDFKELSNIPPKSANDDDICIEVVTDISIEPNETTIYAASFPYNLGIDVEVSALGGGSGSNFVYIDFDGDSEKTAVFDPFYDYSFTKSVSSGTYEVEVDVLADGCIGVIPDSKSKSYTITQLPIPSAPGLSSPSSNALVESSVTFVWSSNGIQSTDQLIIDDNSDFSSPVYNQSGLTTVSKTVVLQRNKTYYWKVRSANAAGTSSWSSTRSVRVRPERPIVTASVQAYAPKLSWSAVSGAVQYEIVRIAHSYPGVSYNFFTTTSTNYLDTSISFPVITAQGLPAFGYKVVAVNASGWSSIASSERYFEEEASGGGGRGF